MDDAFVIHVCALQGVNHALCIHLLNSAIEASQTYPAIDEGNLKEQEERQDQKRHFLPTLHRFPARLSQFPLHWLYSASTKSTEATCSLMLRPMSATSMCCG